MWVAWLVFALFFSLTLFDLVLIWRGTRTARRDHLVILLVFVLFPALVLSTLYAAYNSGVLP